MWNRSWSGKSALNRRLYRIIFPQSTIKDTNQRWIDLIKKELPSALSDDLLSKYTNGKELL